jgi:hypothetical protein
MQGIKMNNVIMLKLGTHQQITNDSGILGNFDPHGIVDCPHRGQSMGVRSDPAGTLHEVMRIPRIASLQNQLDSPEHLA